MRIADYIDENHILFLDGKYSKDELLKIFAKKFKEVGLIENEDVVYLALLEREKLSSTAVGEEVAIPHAKITEIDRIKILIAISKEGQDFDAIDKLPVKLFFIVIAPANQMQLHLKTLARISRLMKMTNFKSRVLAANNFKEVIDILKEEESKL
ncbi:PTS sugar transporter subunit IIA [Deferribacter autotrophicus]|uniref:PTS sugar transporter subunit IIA n=1 Tax=Deferribacter autotrophicus TaxID=500465 RepID=A0A5A8F7Q1_9BACT|nr:PTS sugar transporter subunit IIA [Deferribacter autotrophicus]KAA0258197.1 PTS sugar transporter subunit IIA [Deferribacter autotrophicus]